jgi:hypothetical protein
MLAAPKKDHAAVEDFDHGPTQGETLASKQRLKTATVIL